MTCKAMVDTLLDGDVSRVGSYGARFAGVVFPGETLKASIWKEGDGFEAVVTAPERDDAVALAGVELTPA
jgi:acyl dehydratase